MYSRRNHFNLRLPPDIASPASATSSAFLSPGTPSAQHRALLFGRTPPPSPGLPVDPKKIKRKTGNSTSAIKRLLVVICSAVALAWWGISILYSYATPSEEVIPHRHQQNYEIVADSTLPDEPSAIMVTDVKGKSKWTVSIPVGSEFPLRQQQYAEICSQSMEMSHHLMEQNKAVSKRHRGYYSQDPFYLDVQEAQEQDLVPSPTTTPQTNDLKVCEKSLTYVMETSDAGMGNTLLGLWMSYGLAKHEGRAFFVDDTRWGYGNYSTYFQPPPQADCLPPPTSQIVPCPRTARHLVVSHATTQQVFGHSFAEEWEDPKKMKLQRQHKIFALLRTGYEALFKLRSDDAQYAADRVKALYEPVTAAGGLSVGIHIRRGDRHPYEFQYSKDYLPLTRFLDSAADLISFYFSFATSRSVPRAAPEPSALPSSSSSLESLLSSHASQLILASDDPAIYSAPELAPPITTRAQSHIVLATKSELLKNANSRRRFIDDVSGWEGGFYRDVFWGLGLPQAKTASPATSTAAHVEAQQQQDREKERLGGDGQAPEAAMRLRELVGRSYLLDLEVLSKADAVICAMSSNACRVLGVMVGWEGVGGKEAGRWRNVDGTFHWKGIVW